MLIPLNTDAPVYHWPWVTLTLIVTNVLTYILTGGGSGDLTESFLLEFGTGLHPLEWLSCNFLHFGLMHLIGNMIFLWGFGLVVEGKIGWWRYLAVYLGIGVAGSFFEQLVMLGYEPGESDPKGSGGASLVIYGLMAMAMVWAPKNEVTCLLWLIIRVFVFDVSIQGFAMFYIGLQLLFAALTGFSMSSEVIHLIGAVAGFGVGVAMLKLNWVDCENWDLFAVMNGTYGTQRNDDLYAFRTQVRADESSKKKRRWPEPPPEPEADQEIDPNKQAAVQARTLRRMRQFINEGKPSAAYNEYHKLKHFDSAWQLDEEDLHNLSNGLYKAHRWREAVSLLEEYVERFPKRADRQRLKLAGIALEIQRRPRYALRMLRQIPERRLPEPLERQRTKMARIAMRMIDDGVIELDGRGWS